MSEYKTDLTKCYIWLGKSPGIITYKLAQRGMEQYEVSRHQPPDGGVLRQPPRRLVHRPRVAPQC